MHRNIHFQPALTPTLSQREREHRRGFSLTELLVVIGIIVLLIGLLLVALGQVRTKALRTQSEATMRQFANACTAFQAEYGFYPGVIPDSELSYHEQNTGPSPISSTENALLHLMGGYRVLSPADVNPASPIVVDYNNYPPAGGSVIVNIIGKTGTWKLKVRIDAINGQNIAHLGEGPVIDGKPHAAFYTPGANDLAVIEGQVGEAGVRIPDVVDAWGQPIIYVKQSRERGPVVRDISVTTPPQFELAGVKAYLNSGALGEIGLDQVWSAGPGGNAKGCMLGIGTVEQQNCMFSALLSHPTFYKKPPPATNPLYSTARGAFMLISAGPDGIYFSGIDGPGSQAVPLDTGNIDALIIASGPKAIDQFNDLRVFGGG